MKTHIVYMTVILNIVLAFYLYQSVYKYIYLHAHLYVLEIYKGTYSVFLSAAFVFAASVSFAG